MNYQIQGLSIHAEVHGSAEPALEFLHYWGGTSHTWRKVAAELEGQFKTVAYVMQLRSTGHQEGY